MNNILSFFIDISALKTMHRTGWVWRKIKNPETVAEHSFRTAYMVWVLGERTNLNVRRMMEMALLHDICESYIGDLTPFFGLLPKDPKKRKAMLQRWIRLPQKQKTELSRKRVAMEKKALMCLIRLVQKPLRQEIYALWLEYENGFSAEGRFVKQVDKIEAMVQGIEYFGIAPHTPVVGWWEEVEELVDHPILKEFVHSLQGHFYDRKKTPYSGDITFFLHLGKLKRRPKKGWVVRKVKNPDSVANHLFFLALMSWVLAKEEKKLNIERILKMALSYELYTALLVEGTPHDIALAGAKTEREQNHILKRWTRLSVKEKSKRYGQEYRARKKALEKLTRTLEGKTRKEILHIWQEAHTQKTGEAYFLGQVRILALLLQALLYREGHRRFATQPWWEWAFESIDHKLASAFMARLKRRFVTNPRRQTKVRQ